MKLYVYHIPEHGKMWAILADSQEAAIRLVSQQGIRAVLVTVLSGNGNGVISSAGETFVVKLNEDVGNGK